MEVDTKRIRAIAEELLAALPEPQPEAQDTSSEDLKATDVAQLIKTTPGWVIRNAHEFPGAYKLNVRGDLRFPKWGVDQYRTQRLVKAPDKQRKAS